MIRRLTVFVSAMFLLTLALVIATPSGVIAGPIWGADGIAICDLDHWQLHAVIVSDGSGGAIIGWIDWRGSGQSGIYAQRVDSDGQVQWADNGVFITNQYDGMSYLAAAADGSGGAVFCWKDERSGAEGLYAERVDSSGAPQWSPAAKDGVPVSVASGMQTYPAMISIGGSGCVIAWRDSRSGDTDVYAQRLDLTGARQWENPLVPGDYDGVPICDAPYDQYGISLVNCPGDSTVIAVWYDNRNTGTTGFDIYAQKITTADGNDSWATNGVQVCGQDGQQSRPAAVPDGANGSVIYWEDHRNSEAASGIDIYAQRIDNLGAKEWGASGVVVCNALERQLYPCAIGDGSGNSVVCWRDDRASDNAVYAQKADSNGVSVWTPNGVLVNDGTGGSSASSNNPFMIGDGSGGAYVIWGNLYIQRINSSGSALWKQNGGYINTHSDGIAGLHIVLDTSHPILCWDCHSGSSGYDVKAQSVDGASVTSCSPSSGKQGKTLDVVVNGEMSDFDESSVANFGEGITVNSTSRISATKVRANITIDEDAYDHGRDVYVQTGDKVTFPLINGFTIEQGDPPPPEVSSVEPSSGKVGQILNVKIYCVSNVSKAKLIRDGKSIDATNIDTTYSSYLKCTFDLSGASTGKWDVKVIDTIGQYGVLEEGFTVKEADRTYPTWYLAEGSTKWGFDCWITLENPNDTEVTAEVTFMTADQQNVPGTIVLPRMSQTYIDPLDLIGEQDFSTKVECLEGKNIAVDRTMMWQADENTCPEAHSSIGVTAPAKKWYLPEGSSKWGFETWLLIQNPGNSDALCTLTYMIEGRGPVVVEKLVPARSRKTFFMADDVGEADASIMVESNVPVIPERAMYRNNRREGHDSIGTTAPASDYYLAEGSTDWGFTTYILVQNPNPEPTDVAITYMTPTGPLSEPVFTMPPQSRKTIRANDNFPGRDLSTKVHGSNPIIAERAMYWDSGYGEACHDSIGLDAPHTIFYMPDGANYYDVVDGYVFDIETWTLVQNPNNCEVDIEVSYLSPGEGVESFEDTLEPNSRMSYDMGDRIRNGDAAIMVECLTEGKKIMVERAMYMFERGVGTCTIGGYSDIE